MKKSLVLFLLLLLVGFVSASYSIDISGLQSEEYNLGEDINFRVVLLDGETFVDEEVLVSVTDTLGKKEVSKTIRSNQDAFIRVGSDFPSGLWHMTASAGEVSVERPFSVGVNLAVEFVIEDDNLIIRNLGNTRYTKTVEITIGDTKNSYVQNIGVGEEKVLKLISAEGSYNIEVTDGTNSIRRENVQLFGTGNVIGAVDEDLVGYTGFAGAADPVEEGQFFSFSKVPLAMTFIVGVLILGALIVVERRISKKKGGSSGSSGTGTFSEYKTVGV